MIWNLELWNSEHENCGVVELWEFESESFRVLNVGTPPPQCHNAMTSCRGGGGGGGKHAYTYIYVDTYVYMYVCMYVGGCCVLW